MIRRLKLPRMAAVLTASSVALVALGGSGPADGSIKASLTPTAPALVASPVDGDCYFSNTYGAARPGGRLHEGVDIIADEGTPLVAVADGIISKLVVSHPELPSNGGGNYIRLRVRDGSYYTYIHMQGFADGIAQGVAVSAGQLVGFVGHTGAAPIPHLHFEVHPQGGASVDPTPYVEAVGACRSHKPHTKPTTTTLAPTTTVVYAETVPLAPAARGAAGPPLLPDGQTAVQPGSIDVFAPPASTDSTEPGTTPASNPVVTPIGQVVYRGGMVADHVSGVTVVGFPGMPATTTAVTLAITMTSAADGRAAIWSCGLRAGLDAGIPLAPLVAGSAVVSTVTLAPGTLGRVCLVSTAAVQLEVAVVALS